MKTKKLNLLLMLIGFASLAKAQLTTTNTLTPQQLVQQVLLGAGVTASNITFTGTLTAIAQFTASASTNIGISSGVIMSTGKANGASGSVSLSASTSYGLSGDVDLNAIIPDTYDACILEFDFVPLGDTLSFNYVFASDEYPNYVCSSYADVFGYLVSGPNPLGGLYNKINIATIPGSSLPVSINSINSGNPGSGYPSSDCISTAYSTLFVSNQIPVNTFVKYNGMSIVLTAKLPVVCGQTYHIKMGIADVSDGTLDSGVLLQKGSFSSAPPISLNTNNANSAITDTLFYEDCNTYCLKFIRTGNIALKDSFMLNVAGNAINGSDYATLTGTVTSNVVWPSNMVFQANQDTFKICDIKVLDDGILENLDTLVFNVSKYNPSATSCVQTNIVKLKIYLSDYTPIDAVGAKNDTVCENQSATLFANPLQGTPPYSFSWLPGSVNTNSYVTAPITSQTIYTITVNDICNKPVAKTITVTPVPTPTVTVNSETICAGNTTTISATGATTYTWNTGIINQSTTVSPSSTTNYTVIGTVKNCTNSAVSTVSVINQNITITGNNQICVGQNTQLTANGASTYIWNNGATSFSIITTPTVTSNYTVTSIILTCTNSAVYQVSVVPIPTVSVSGSVICSGQNANLIATGATTYTWNTGATTSNINVSPPNNTTYTVTGETVSNCTNTSVYTLTVITSEPLLSALNYTFCLDTTKAVPVLVTDGSPPYTINWLIPGNGIIPIDTINNTYYFMQQYVPSNETYTITVNDQCNKKDTLTISLTTINCTVIVPNIITADGNGINDVFKINGLENFPGSALIVFNRWGHKIYSNDDYKNDWKPTVNNSGTYFYTLNIPDGRKFNGFFQLFKD